MPAAGENAGMKLRIGLLRLTDSAPVIVAHEFGYFAEEGLDVELSVEPSWANIADKLAYGFLDAAVIVPPLAFAITLGLRGTAQPLLIPYMLSLGGNAITLAQELAGAVRQKAFAEKLTIPQAFAACLHADSEPPVLGVVHAYSTHNLLLRYWLASAGLEAGRDVKLSVVPPALAVEALQSGRIAGFCAGAPWGEVAARAKTGSMVATSHDIWRNAPEKGFAVRETWAEQNPQGLQGALRALARAAQFCDAPENASYTAALLSRKKYLDVSAHAILSSLPGGSPEMSSAFYRNAATFPWRSHALWLLREMVRWKLLAPETDLVALAARVYRPDLYRAALAPLGISIPRNDMKSEGSHTGPWMLDASPAPIPMGADIFCDGAIFEPESVGRS